MIRWLAPDSPPDAFPAVSAALRSPNGLLAGGGDLSVERLLAAYRRGIFPWFSEGQPILWWSPDPRAVYRIGRVRVARRLARHVRSRRPVLHVDRDFAAVIDACAAPRSPLGRRADRDPADGDGGTWITPAMRAAYLRLFRQGTAHCVEVEIDGRVVGGLYGLAIGRAFFGESMVSHAPEGSKLALVGLDRWLAAGGYELLDAQVESGHVMRMGAELWPRARFVRALAALCDRAPERPLAPTSVELDALLRS